MFNVAHRVVLKPFKFAFYQSCITHGLSYAPGFLYILERVAQALARLCRMVPIVAQTEPAELIAALATSHVHAALVFLDRTLALGAGLGV